MVWQQLILISSLSALFLLTAGQSTNSPPSWVQSSVDVFPQGFSEATQVGTLLTVLRCTDPENDRIRYRLRSGNAVSVFSNGSTILNSELDFEQQDQLGYDLTFTCVDENANGIRLHPEVEIRTQISVNDANDNRPEFEVDNADGYAFFISEAAPVGTLVEDRIKTIDLDRTQNAELKTMYLICNSTNATEREAQPESSKAFCQNFRLTYNQIGEGRYQAFIYTTANLDYEVRSVYSSKIVAIDGPGLDVSLTSTVNVQINIEDEQDRDPIFTNLAASTTVSEGAQIGTIINFNISARDGDTGARRAIALSIIDDPKDAFNLTTAVPNVDRIYHSSLIVKNPLDRETNLGAYFFVVLATELNNNSQPTTATASATYSVIVSDINDNAPTFSQPVYNQTVTELNVNATNSSVQITGLHIICSDPDEPSNAKYIVSVVSQRLGSGQPIQAYSVSPGLEFIGNASMFLKVDNPIFLDYDNPDYREQVVELVARETETRERLSSSTTISIFLQDINDNSPQFSQQSYEISIPEETQAPTDFCSIPGIVGLCRITATDRDSEENGRLRYRLEGDFANFRINATTGVLSLLDSLDYETTIQYVFLVYATDQATQPRSTQVQVTINVINYNDEKPIFTQNVYRTSVNESSTQFLNPVEVKATDNEDGTGDITYRLLPGDYPSDSFEMDEQTGRLTLLKTLNYELTPMGNNGQRTGVFILRVEASDNGVPPQTSEAEIQVTVIDQNNHAPVLNQTFFFITIPEIADEETIVANITGTDADGGDNGKISYRLGTGASDNFNVESETGIVRVGATQSFDVDLQDSYTLLIIATDGGAPQKSATATVSVSIIDSNNKSPVFGRNFYQASVDQLEPVGFIALTAAATDDDSTASLTYSIVRSTIRATDGNGNSLVSTSPYDYTEAFDVNQNGGIFIKNQLRREFVQEIRFTLQVRDLNTEKGIPTATTQVTMIITGDVEARITFDTITEVFMSEDAPVGSSPVRVTARDLSNKPVNFYTNMTYSPYFIVQGDGTVVLDKNIDYETDTQPNHEHYVVVRALSDQGQSATTTVTIMVMDVNDNDPKFEEDSYEAEVMEDARYPTPVLNIFATDADSTSYGPLDFRIAGGLNSDDFEIFLEQVPPTSIVSRRAQVLVARGKTLDYNRRREYDLDLIVGDNADRTFSSKRNYARVKLTIKVIDVNDHSPVFKEVGAVRRLAIPETATLGQSIATIVATDEDDGQNGEIRYTLERAPNTADTEALKLFVISPQLGIVSVADSLLGKASVYKLQVRARDRGEIPRSSILQLEIRVLSTEDNDGNPKWLSPENGYVVTAPEEEPGYVLRDFNNNTRFFDAIPRNGTVITYSLSQVGPYARDFSIDSITGEITVTGSLDREKQEIYELLVYAEDTVDPLNVRTGRLIRVRLLDKDDNDATFYNPNNYPGCTVLDFPYIVRVRENTPINVTVDRLRACDPDSPVNSLIYYSWYNGNDYCTAKNSLSGIYVESDGRLVTRKRLDYEEEPEYIMCVEATSRAPTSGGRKKRAFDTAAVTPILSNVAYIEIQILDENDNKPRFPFPTATGVVSTEPGTGPVVPLNAVDRDGPGRNVIVYSIEESLFYPQETSKPSARVQAFTLRSGKAALYPALPSFQQFSGGRFEVTVVAYDNLDSSLNDTQKITIYVYEDGNAVKAVLDIPPETGITRGEEFVSGLNNVDNRYFFSYLSVSEHRNGDDIDSTRTDVCFIAIDTKSDIILNIRGVVDVLDSSAYEDQQDTYRVVDRGQCYPSESSESSVKWRDLWWVLVAVAIFLFVCCLILIILVLMLYDRYKSYMETRKTYLISQ